MSFTKISSEIARSISEAAYRSDTQMAFPQEAFDILRNAGLLEAFSPGKEFDLARHQIREQLHLLRQIGAADLSVARIFEGHLNALALISRVGTDEQRFRWFEAANKGKIFGVWNTEAADGIHFNGSMPQAVEVKGSKTFCSGSTSIDFPVITGKLDDIGWQMAVVDLKNAGLEADKTFWDPLGMRSSVSHRINFSGLQIPSSDLLGQPGDYYHQPGFGGGAIRFSAVQIGGAQSIVELTIAYLRDLGRTDDQSQKERVSEMAILVNNGFHWINEAGRFFEKWHGAQQKTGDLLNMANMMRHAVEEICNRVMQLSERSVGARGLCAPEDSKEYIATFDITFGSQLPTPHFWRLVSIF